MQVKKRKDIDDEEGFSTWDLAVAAQQVGNMNRSSTSIVSL
jgi:hypothetical protein